MTINTIHANTVIEEYKNINPVQEPSITAIYRKKILLLGSNGGGAHNAAAATIQEVLCNQYNITVVYPIDQMKIWRVDSGEQLYNFMLQNNWAGPVNWVTSYLAPTLFQARENLTEAIIQKQIDLAKPELLISLIPFINYPASEAARKSHIPFLLVTLDNDLRLWMHGCQKIQHPFFKITTASSICNSSVAEANIPSSAIESIGLPVRSNFFTAKEKKMIRKEFNIPKSKPVVLVMMGGAGGNKVWEYIHTIGLAHIGVHMIACAGKNQELAQKLHNISLYPKNSMSVIEFTTKISDLMAVSDLVITKPGPSTINEAMIMKLPIIVDATSTVLDWEKINIDLVQKYHIGKCVETFEELVPLLQHMLRDPTYRQDVQKAYQTVPPNRFLELIEPLVFSMLTNSAHPV